MIVNNETKRMVKEAKKLHLTVKRFEKIAYYGIKRGYRIFGSLEELNHLQNMVNDFVNTTPAIGVHKGEFVFEIPIVEIPL